MCVHYIGISNMITIARYYYHAYCYYYYYYCYQAPSWARRFRRRALVICIVTIVYVCTVSYDIYVCTICLYYILLLYAYVCAVSVVCLCVC